MQFTERLLNKLRRKFFLPLLNIGSRLIIGVPWSDIKRPRMVYNVVHHGNRLKGTRISDTAYFWKRENIHIGENVFIWHNTILDGTCKLSIGEGCQIGACVGLFTHSSHITIRLYGEHFGEFNEFEMSGFQSGDITIGKYVYIASGSYVLPGVTIGDGAIVGAGSVVSTNVEPFTAVSGNPAKKIGNVRTLDKVHLSRIKDPQISEWYNGWQNKAAT
jgi:acetyltransferase-like isoleucine patch superfamily enzyme